MNLKRTKHRTQASDVASYIRSLKSLEKARVVAEDDRFFATRDDEASSGFEKPSTVYIFDSNVCLSFLRPHENVFIDAAGISGLFSGQRHLTVERMTLRYMFDGSLPGQDGEPVFLAPAHWNELLHKTEIYLKQETDKAAQMEQRISDETLARLQKADSPERLVELAEELDVARALQDLGDAIGLGQRADILFGKSDRDGRIRGLDHATSTELYSFWNEARTQVSWRAETEWRRAITQTRREAEHERMARLSSRAREDTLIQQRRAILNDASSLAFIETLYMVDPFAGSEMPRRQYLFVTSDRAVAGAFELQKNRLEQNGIPVFVRSPATFMPFSGYEYFHDVITRDFDHTSSSVETSNKIRDALGSLRTAHDVDGQPNLTSRRVKKLQSNWNETADLLSLIGNEQFVEDFSQQSSAEQVKKTYHYLGYEKIGVAVERMLQSKMANVAKRHERANVESALRILPDKLRSPDEGTSEPRAPIHFLTVDILHGLRRAELTRSSKLPGFLDELRRDAAGEGKLIRRTADLLLETWRNHKTGIPSPETLLLTAVMLTSAGMWQVALECANDARVKARKRQNKNPGRRRGRSKAARPPVDAFVLESAYLCAVCLRMTLRNEEQYKTATERLNGNIESRNFRISTTLEDRLAYHRDRIERSTLTLTAAVLQCIETSSAPLERDDVFGGLFIAAEDLAHDYQEAIERLEETAAVLENDFLGTGSHHEDATLILGLIKRALTNVLGAEINRYFLPPLQPGSGVLEDIRQVAQRIHTIREEYAGDLPRNRSSQEIYLKIADFMTSTSRSSDNFEDLVSDIEAIRDTKAAAAPDDAEMGFLKTALENLAESRGVRTR